MDWSREDYCRGECNRCDAVSNWEHAIYDEEFTSSNTSGKYLLFISPQFRNEWWEKISNAVLAGELGPAAKVSVTPRNNRYVICVYCADTESERTTLQVRGALRELGVTWQVPYKTCAMSASGIKGSLFSA